MISDLFNEPMRMSCCCVEEMKAMFHKALSDSDTEETSSIDESQLRSVISLSVLYITCYCVFLCLYQTGVCVSQQ